jgi:predicted RNase H-like HicB family nuclease
MYNLKINVIVTREDGGFVSRCDGTDIASQGTTAQEATANLKEAVQLILGTA